MNSTANPAPRPRAGWILTDTRAIAAAAAVIVAIGWGWALWPERADFSALGSPPASGVPVIAEWEAACAAVNAAKADLEHLERTNSKEAMRAAMEEIAAARRNLAAARTPAEVAVAQDALQEARREVEEMHLRKSEALEKLKAAESRRAATIGPAEKALGRRFQY